LLKPLLPQWSLSTFLLMLGIVMWKLHVMKQLCERQIRVLGSPLKSLMCFLSRKNMPCIHKAICQPTFPYGFNFKFWYFCICKFSSMATVNFRMWNLKNLLWFIYLLVWYWSFVMEFQKISTSMWLIVWHRPNIDCPIPNFISTFKKKLAC
jgi:hypothetical protein